MTAVTRIWRFMMKSLRVTHTKGAVYQIKDRSVDAGCTTNAAHSPFSDDFIEVESGKPDSPAKHTYIQHSFNELEEMIAALRLECLTWGT